MSEGKEISALKGTEVAAGIDMRLSKSDIIDMVVEERKAELEEILKGLETKREPLMLEFKKLGDDHATNFAAEFEKDNKALIDAFKKSFPKAKVEVEKQSNHRYYVSRNKGVTEFQCNDDTGESAYVSASIHVMSNDSNGHRCSGSQLSLNGSSKELAKKLVKEAKAVVDKIRKLEEEIDGIKGLMSDLSKRGGRFKAEFTKRMLAGTEQGKSILASLDGVRNIVKGIK